MGKLKRNVCEAESDCILFRVPRGDCIVGSDCAAPARVGNESFTAGARVEFRGDFIVLALAGAGGRGSPGERVSARPDWVGRSGRGMALVSRNGKGRGNAIVSGSGEVETECLCSGKRLFFISNTARGLFHKKRLDSTRAGRERKFHGRSACGVSRKFIASSLAGRVTDSSGSRGGAGSPIEGKQKAFVPPPAGRAGRVPRESFRGKCRFPPAGFASRGQVASPRRETRRPPFRRASRGSTGGGFPGFADFTTWDRSAPVQCFFRSRSARGNSLYFRCTIAARHACRNSRSRSARAETCNIRQYNPRAVLEIKYNRFPLHKRPVSTSPFPLTPAFLQPSASGERSATPRPCLKKQGRAGVFPVGGSAPSGRAFSVYFSPRREK